ncbi:MAG: DNA polymerase III subunit delta [Sphingomicrobium sp.]
MKIAKGQIGRLVDQPGSDTRFYLFWGPDEGQSRALGMRLLQALSADRFIVISSAIKADPATLPDEAGALALFGGKRVIWIEPAGEEIRDGIAALLEAPTPESPVVAIAPSSARPKELIKIAEASPLAACFAAYLPEGQEAERMVVDLGRRFGLRIDRTIAARVAEACGNDQAIVAQELEKLSLFLDASTSRPIDLDGDALDAVGANLDDSDFPYLADLALTGEMRELSDTLGGIGSANEAIPVLRALQRRLLMLAPARARVERGESPENVMASMGKALFWKDKVKFGAMLSRWTAADLARLAERATVAERALLFGNSPEVETLGEELIAVARAARRR